MTSSDPRENKTANVTRSEKDLAGETTGSVDNTADLSFSASALIQNDLPDTEFEDFVAPAGYELREFVGAGGMGMVFRAHDLELERDIALKFLKQQHDADSLTCRRFLFEAKVTAQLQHPGIPAVHEVGELEDGRPYIAMKLIKGSDLKKLLSDRGPGGADWLAVFEAICQAVGYAHAHDVVHRDLKPHNAMVGAFGEVQVMDWGLAKLLNPPHGADTDDRENSAAETRIGSLQDSGTDYTRAGSVLGTPAYMAPEQAIGAVDRLNKRTDVFGLGGILCAMLTGKAPYVGDTGETVRQMAAQGRLDDAFNRLDACGAEPEWIELTKRCLAADQDARLADAEEVAATVAQLRKESDERARVAEMEEEAAKVQLVEQKKRRRVTMIAGSVTMLVLVAGIIGTAIGLYYADQQRRSAEANETAANDRRAEMEEVLDFVDKRVFASARPKGQDGGLGHDVKMRDAVVAAMESIPATFASRPLIGARVNLMIANSLDYLSEYKLSEPLLRETYDLYCERFGKDDPKTLAVLSQLAATYSMLGDWDKSQQMHEETLAVQKKVLGPDHVETLQTMHSLCGIYVYRGMFDDAVAVSEKALAGYRAKFGDNDPRTAGTMVSVAYSYQYAGRAADGEELLLEALQIFKDSNGEKHPATLQCMHNVSMVQANLGKYRQAAERTEKTLAYRKEVLGTDHDNTHWSRHNLGICYAHLGRNSEAIELFEETLAVWKVSEGEDHPATLETKHWLATAYLNQGRYDDARELLEETVALAENRLTPNHPSTLFSKSVLATAFRMLGRFSEAIRLQSETLELLKEKNGADHRNTIASMRDLATCYAAVGRYQEAVQLHEKSLELQTRKFGDDHPETLACMWGLADAYAARGDYDEAVNLFRDSYDRLNAELGEQHPWSLYVCGRLAEVLARIGAAAEAISLADQGLQTVDADEPLAAHVFASLVMGRLRGCASKNDLAGCRETENLWVEKSFTDPVSLHKSARIWAVIAGVLQATDTEDGTLNLADAKKTANDWLDKAIESGYQVPDKLVDNDDFAAIRESEQ